MEFLKQLNEILKKLNEQIDQALKKAAEKR